MSTSAINIKVRPILTVKRFHLLDFNGVLAILEVVLVSEEWLMSDNEEYLVVMSDVFEFDCISVITKERSELDIY